MQTYEVAQITGWHMDAYHPVGAKGVTDLLRSVF
jgi:hypothetical protein